MADLPTPRATLRGCMWLPRIIAKARLIESGALPAEYAARFCHPTGVDAQFLRFFELQKEDIISASRGTDEHVALWFDKLTAGRPSLIPQWNELAQNLGRPGFPWPNAFRSHLPVLTSTWNPPNLVPSSRSSKPMKVARQMKREVLKECAALADRLQPLAFIVLPKIQSAPKEERKRWGAYASSRVVFGVSPNRFSGGTPEIARGDACAP